MTMRRKSYNNILMANYDIKYKLFLQDLGFYGGHIQANHEFPIIHLEAFYFTEGHLGICQTFMCLALYHFCKKAPP